MCGYDYESTVDPDPTGWWVTEDYDGYHPEAPYTVGRTRNVLRVKSQTQLI
jgi:hypothetical protein